MIINHATWEKRNIGKECREIIIEPEDESDINQVRRSIKENIVEYTVVKVPTGLTNVMFLLQDMGFYFIEGQTQMSHDLKCHEVCITEEIREKVKHCSLLKMEESELPRLFCELRKEIFYTDRISIDPEFGKAISAERYINWVKDGIARGTGAFEFYYCNEPSGFVQFYIDEILKARTIVIGLYLNRSIAKGGYLLRYMHLCEAASQGALEAIDVASINNPKIIRVNLALGYKYEGTKYVFVKHIKGAKC